LSSDNRLFGFRDTQILGYLVTRFRAPLTVDRHVTGAIVQPDDLITRPAKELEMPLEGQ